VWCSEGIFYKDGEWLHADYDLADNEATVEERWDHDGQRWYCREMIRADVVDDRIVEMSVYCTGDWDEARQRDHAAAVRLIRP